VCVIASGLNFKRNKNGRNFDTWFRFISQLKAKLNRIEVVSPGEVSW